jgi:hypothetical protein
MTENGKPFLWKIISFFLAVGILGALWTAYYIIFTKGDITNIQFWIVNAMIIAAILVGDNISSLFKIFTLHGYLDVLLPHQCDMVALSAKTMKHLKLKKLTIEQKREQDQILNETLEIEKVIEQYEKEKKGK